MTNPKQTKEQETKVKTFTDTIGNVDYTYDDDEEHNAWEKVGVCTVDAGMIWFGDPCYFIPRKMPDGMPDMERAGILQDYNKFLSVLDKLRKTSKTPGATEFDHENGVAGLGVLINNFGGDGSYKVYVKRTENGLTKEAKIVFCDEED